ncbi:MBL fold metallo-hydrolase [Microbacter sp. GSS18]|nr:MBL fold metallo-hydrolase [Microbacter sp. GSS18]
MTKTRTTATVRMYNVGFGDAFVVTVSRSKKVWRMLVDCGVSRSSQARPIAESVRAIIDDLIAVSPAGSPPRLDVVVATHHHADHIAGFADPAWEEVEVGEVWVPFIEDADDADARALRTGQVQTAHALSALIGDASQRLAAAEDPRARDALTLAAVFAANSSGNDIARDRLLGQNGLSFKNTPTVRYVPAVDPVENVVPTPIPRTVVHLLGPSRDHDDLKRMNPPKAVRWLQLTAEERLADDEDQPPFEPAYAVPFGAVDDEVPSVLQEAQKALNLSPLADEADELLAASSVLERAVNNTSVYFVLDVDGTRLVFVGDSQYGAWKHVLDDPESRALVTDPAFYKVGHHGSHNATPKEYVTEELLGRGHVAMMPFRLVPQWPSIPEHKLLDELEELDTHVIRADDPEGPDVTVDEGGLWSEVTFTASARASRA